MRSSGNDASEKPMPPCLTTMSREVGYLGICAAVESMVAEFRSSEAVIVELTVPEHLVEMPIDGETSPRLIRPANDARSRSFCPGTSTFAQKPFRDWTMFLCRRLTPRLAGQFEFVQGV